MTRSPSDSLSAYFSIFDLVMESIGLSSAKKSGRTLPLLYPGGTVVYPPVHRGMEPSALPARSAPSGVRSDLSFAASSGEAAQAPFAATMSVAATTTIREFFELSRGRILKKCVAQKEPQSLGHEKYCWERCRSTGYTSGRHATRS